MIDHDVDAIIGHIQENISKAQYWNAISWSIDLQRLLVRRQDMLLKNVDARIYVSKKGAELPTPIYGYQGR